MMGDVMTLEQATNPPPSSPFSDVPVMLFAKENAFWQEGDEIFLNNLPPELPQMRLDAMRQDEELPSSRDASIIHKDDVSSITSYSIFSKVQRRRRLLKRKDAEVPTNPEPPDVAIPAFVDLPCNIPFPSLVSLGNIGIVPSKDLALLPSSLCGGILPAWVKESPVWIKRLLLICFLLLLAALFMIFAVASRQAVVGNNQDGSDGDRLGSSIGLEDIADTYRSAFPTQIPTLSPPVSSPYPTLAHQEYPTFSPLAWQAGLPALLRTSTPTETLENDTADSAELPTSSSPPTASPTTHHLSTDEVDVHMFWGYRPSPPRPPTPPPTLAMMTMRSMKMSMTGRENVGAMMMTMTGDSSQGGRRQRQRRR